MKGRSWVLGCTSAIASKGSQVSEVCTAKGNQQRQDGDDQISIVAGGSDGGAEDWALGVVDPEALVDAVRGESGHGGVLVGLCLYSRMNAKGCTSFPRVLFCGLMIAF